MAKLGCKCAQGGGRFAIPIGIEYARCAERYQTHRQLTLAVKYRGTQT